MPSLQAKRNWALRDLRSASSTYQVRYQIEMNELHCASHEEVAVMPARTDRSIRAGIHIPLREMIQTQRSISFFLPVQRSLVPSETR